MINKTWIVVGIIVFAILALLIAWVFMPSQTEWSSAKENETPQKLSVDKQAQENQIEPSSAGIALAFIILVAMTVLVLIASRATTFGQTMGQPAFIALMASVVLCALLYIFWYPAWKQFWGHQSIFWGSIICSVIISFLFTRPDNQRFFRFAGYAMIAVIGIGTILQTKSCGFTTEKLEKSSIISRTVTKNNLSYGVPVEIALLKICDCESGDGTLGSAKQFNPDGSVVRNTNGTPDDPTDDDVGTAQINLKHQAGLIEELKADVEKSEKDNLRVGIELYKREGPDPWSASRDCWEPKLRALALGGEAVVLVVRAPKDDWSDLITCPVKPGGGKVDLSGEGEEYFVRWNEGKASEVEELLPRKEPSKQPDCIYNFRLKGKGSGKRITVKFY